MKSPRAWSVIALFFLLLTLSLNARADGAPRPSAAGRIALDAQVAGALLAAPEEMRAEARVLAYGADGRLQVAREGSNALVCLASSPSDESFQAACYHRDLEPYMARGRALRREGVTGEANRERRWAEIEAGALSIPRAPRTLYVLSGKGFDPKTRTVTDPFLRWVVYVPFATAGSIGLSDQPNPEGPWLMHAGTPGAHIMMTPPSPPPSSPSED